MKDFLHKLGKRVMGVLSGFDRMLFRGMLRAVVDARGRHGHLYGAGVAMKDFKAYAQRTTEQLKEQSLARPRAVGCEIKYLDDPKVSKKDLAVQIARRDGIRDGLICVPSAVEPCQTFHVRRCWTTNCAARGRRCWMICGARCIRPGGVLRLETTIGRAKPDGTRTRPRSFRALNPFNPDDIRLLTVVSKTEFVINGLRNADERLALCGEAPTSLVERRRRSSRVSRLLGLLRVHGILHKVSKGHHDRVTDQGRRALTALLAAANATTNESTNLAA